MSNAQALDEKSLVMTPEEKRFEGYEEQSTPDGVLVDHEDGDEALQLVSGSTQRVKISEEENRRLLRKIDFCLLPLMCILYGLEYLDKTTLSYSSIMGFEQAIHLGKNQYQWLGSIFYFGYLVWEWPTNRLMQRLPLAKYIAANIILWGVILSCMAAGRNWSDLMALRFLLGIFESPLTPGFTLFTSQWYTNTEQGFRTAVWWSFTGFSSVFGGCVSYGLAAHASSLAIPAWKVIYIFCGTTTIAFGLLFLAWMPDSPATARWLTPDERIVAIERIRGNQQGIGNKHFKRYQAKEALMDPQAWLFVLIFLIGGIPNGGLTNYFSILIESFGFSEATSLLYAAIGGGVQVIAVLGSLYLGQRFKMRLFFTSFCELIAILGLLLVYCLPDHFRVGRLIGYSLTQANSAPSVAILSLVSSNIAGYTKKTTVLTMLYISYCVGNLVGPQIFRDQDAPKYTPALITIIICWIVCFILLYLLWAINVRDNRRRDALAEAEGTNRKRRANQEFLDLTDRENLDFRYVS